MNKKPTQATSSARTYGRSSDLAHGLKHGQANGLANELPRGLPHGGRLLAAAEQYNIPPTEWLDLSTGINPVGWPVPPPPASYWSRLPEDEDGLIEAAARYYQIPTANNLLAVAGSQAAIQALPTLRPRCRVALLRPAYAEHEWAWRQQGHDVTVVEASELEPQLSAFDVVVLINPNNPTGQQFAPEQLLAWRKRLANRPANRLADRGGWLIVDEAFMDATPEHSVVHHCTLPGLIVLRSLGKFFGLAGARVGFVAAERKILQALQLKLGPWSVAGPARWVAKEALNDQQWQTSTREHLPQQAQRLRQLLTAQGLLPSGSCSLFQWIKTPEAATLHRMLAQQAVLTRYFSEPSSLRFGLPASETHWQKLEQALARVVAEISQ